MSSFGIFFNKQKIMTTVKYSQIYSSAPNAITQILMAHNTTLTKQDELRVSFVLSEPSQQISDASQINVHRLSHANTTHCLFAALVFQTC